MIINQIKKTHPRKVAALFIWLNKYFPDAYEEITKRACTLRFTQFDVAEFAERLRTGNVRPWKVIVEAFIYQIVADYMVSCKIEQHNVNNKFQPAINYQRKRQKEFIFLIKRELKNLNNQKMIDHFS